jgi:signal transduction histidine kinase
MRRLQILLTAILITGGFYNSTLASINNSASQAALSVLEQRLKSIDEELKQLAGYSLRSGTGAIGYESKSHRKPDHQEWVRIELGEPVPIDQVVLVPSIRRNSQTGLQAECFPIAFRIMAGNENTTNVLATFTAEDGLLPRIAPISASFSPINASWVKIEATRLSPRGWDAQYALHLAEVFVFSGMENVALNKPVSASSSRHFNGRDKRFIVDGFIHYLMETPTQKGTQPVTFRTNNKSEQITLTIDLRRPELINQINLHMTDLSYTIQETSPSDWARPHRLRVTAAKQANFSDETVLFEYQCNSVYDIGPILSRRFPKTQCRYVRFYLLESHDNTDSYGKHFITGLAEIEVLSNGQNIARRKPVSCSIASRPSRVLARITDGKNYLGTISPIRTWINQLARRHDLETERPRIEAELKCRYMRHKKNLTRMYWVTGLLIAGTVIGFLLELIIRQKAIHTIRKRISANLHDELGANLNAIGLLGDSVKEIVNQRNSAAEWPQLTTMVDNIRELTEETCSTARHCSNLLEAEGFYQTPAQDMKRLSDNLLTDLNYVFSVTNEKFLDRLKPRRRVDLVLFYKECLTNIIRHSGATKVSIQLSATPRHIHLSITDNGSGTHGTFPDSLKRRARLMKASFSMNSPESGGTTITVRLRSPRSVAALKSLLSKISTFGLGFQTSNKRNSHE